MLLLAPAPSPSPAAPPGVVEDAVARVLSPTGVCVTILLALVIDYLSVGPNSIRDRVAFFLAITALHDGFDGSPLDRWTVGALSDLIGQLLDATGGAYIAGASINVVIGAAVGILWIYAVGCVLPENTPRMGRFVAMAFPTGNQYRINWKLWAIALFLGMMSDLPQGMVGEATRFSMEFIAGFVSPLPEMLFGAV